MIHHCEVVSQWIHCADCCEHVRCGEVVTATIISLSPLPCSLPSGALELASMLSLRGVGVGMGTSRTVVVVETG